jgi:hypothetical protein
MMGKMVDVGFVVVVVVAVIGVVSLGGYRDRGSRSL